MKVARLEEELDNLTKSKMDNMVDKLGDFNRIKRQSKEYGTMVSNPAHKFLGKLPSSFESFKNNIYLCVPFPSYEEALGLLHDKCLSCKSSSKHDFVLFGQAKGKPKPKGKGNPKGKNCSSKDTSKKGNQSSSKTSKWNVPFVDVLTTSRSDALQRKEHPRQPKRR